MLLEIKKGIFNDKRVDPLVRQKFPNINAINFRTPKCTEQKLIKLKGDTEDSAILAGYFNITFRVMDKIT